MPQPDLELFEFSSQNLFRLLSNPHCSTTVVANKTGAQYLSRYLEEMGARAILVEEKYVDRDYLDDHASYYVRCFAEYPRFCSRLHFFSKALNAQDVDDVVMGRAPSSGLQDYYLGFNVRRPLPDAVIGRTALKTYGSDSGRRHYACTRNYPVNLFGVQLNVESLAFQEQDTVLAACATVALWCCFHKTSHLFGSSEHTPAEITRAANSIGSESRLLPSHSLRVHQLCSAISQFGLEPEVYKLSPGVPLSSLMYSYLSMGLPVLLGVSVGNEGEGHAIAVTGFSQRNSRAIASDQPLSRSYVPTTALNIDEFYAHDDQFGPFARLRVSSPLIPSTGYGDQGVFFYGEWKNESGLPIPLVPRVVVVPVHPKMRLTFLDFHQWILRLDDLIARLPGTHQGQIWDITLTASNSLKQELRSTGATPEIRDFLYDTQPRFIWRAKLRIFDFDVLEILADATGIARSFPLTEIIWKMPQFKSFLNGYLTIAPRQGLEERLTPSLFEFLLRKSSS